MISLRVSALARCIDTDLVKSKQVPRPAGSSMTRLFRDAEKSLFRLVVHSHTLYALGPLTA